MNAIHKQIVEKKMFYSNDIHTFLSLPEAPKYFLGPLYI